ncbi:MAG: hypothetical protein K0S43_3092, partial [Cellulosimicrobium sp.]|nr:hypothetical protein [Cellulosimicrobium sp.]
VFVMVGLLGSAHYFTPPRLNEA